jgi:threonine-phosphate decarboxylase
MGSTDDFSQKHGGIAHEAFERLGVAPREVVDFSVNLSPLDPPEGIADVLANFLEHIRRYPSADGHGIVRYYAEEYGVDPESVLAGNGSTEFLYLVPRAIGPSRVVVPTPAYRDYTRAARLAGADVTWIQLNAEEGFPAPTIDRIRKSLSDGDALLIGNPNDPTGTVYDPEMLLELADSRRDVWVIVDEAFVGFVSDQARVSLIAPERIRSNIIVLRSLTNTYALPGLRVGCAIGHPDTIGWLRTHKEPWTVSVPAEQVALAAIGSRAYKERLSALMCAERSRVMDRLRKIDGIKALPPTANFILAQWTASADLGDLLRSLLADGFYLCDCRDFTGLERGYFRIGLRLPEQNDALLAALERAAEAARA